MSEKKNQGPPDIRREDRAASGAPRSGWAIGDRFSWEEIHQRLLASADEEISSAPRELFLSGMTAGFAIVLTLIGYAVGTSVFPDNPFLASILYPIGFIYIILGRYQLFTENTLPPVKLVLTRLASLPLLLRVWGIVLGANVLGAALGTLALAYTHVLSPEAMKVASGFVVHGLEMAWWDIFFRALFAGWLVAGVVWIGTAARDTISRLVVVYLVFYMIAVCDLFHVVTAASEMFFVVFYGSASSGLISIFLEFWIPVLLGNTAGGVLVFTFVAYVQSEKRRYPQVRVLTWREVLFSMKGGRPFGTPRSQPDWKENQYDESS